VTTHTFRIEFLTPCFCAGADQSRAELRPSAIRGQLRWWFRVMGGTPIQENEIFGSVHGDGAAASSIIVRTQIEPRTGEQDWFSEANIPRQGVGNTTYLLGFFCGRTNRLQASGALAPGSKATVTLTFRHPVTPLLEQAANVFFSVGAVGFRSSRCAGAFACIERPITNQNWPSLTGQLEKAGFAVALVPTRFNSWGDLVRAAGGLLRDRLRSGTGITAGRNGSKPNALGSAEPRQASVVHLRPLRIDNQLRLALLEAPHSRILGEKARDAHGNRGSILKLAGFLD